MCVATIFCIHSCLAIRSVNDNQLVFKARKRGARADIKPLML